MKKVFADTSYWIGLFHRKDSLHLKTIEISRTLQHTQILTSELVFAEFLNYFGKKGPFLKRKAVDAIRKTQKNENIIFIDFSSVSFNNVLDLYSKRLDKNYSFIDCSSMIIAKDNSIKEIFTTDKHFEQEGFTRLLK